MTFVKNLILLGLAFLTAPSSSVALPAGTSSSFSSPSSIPTPTPSLVPNPNELVVKVIQGTVSDPNFLEVQQSQTVLHTLRARLGRNATISLVEDDIAQADNLWHNLLSANTAANNNNTDFKGAVAVIQGFADESLFNVTTVEKWFAEAGIGFPHMFQATSPEHWLSLSGAGTGDPHVPLISIESWSGGGGGRGLTTYFTGEVDSDPPPYVPRIEGLGHSFVFYYKLLLRDGTVFAHTVTGGRELEGGTGVEVCEGIWVPGNLPDEHLRGIEAHITVEFSNWLRYSFAWANGDKEVVP
ncbi:hypothetical protein F5Y16DRAFT_381281 [Xylariaceae sp. FL0255]|nr:hypothetical protein F5Y16DRAFT_381281 [Xylariaceae sp. FL0255]